VSRSDVTPTLLNTLVAWRTTDAFTGDREAPSPGDFVGDTAPLEGAGSTDLSAVGSLSGVGSALQAAHSSAMVTSRDARLDFIWIHSDGPLTKTPRNRLGFTKVTEAAPSGVRIAADPCMTAPKGSAAGMLSECYIVVVGTVE
jgi:hypothetical protein